MRDPESLVLEDGRRLAYAEYGRADGDPVLCFHGNPGSRLLWSLFDDLAQERGLRLVAPDRPGFGRSTFQPDRDLLDWPVDVVALARHLGVDRFGVVGFSAGGPFALACGDALADRVERTVLVGSPAPPEINEYAGATYRRMERAAGVPGLLRGMFGVTGWLARNWRSRFEAAITGDVSDPDEVLFDGPTGDLLVADAAEAFRQGGKGPAQEFPLLCEPWGLDPAAAEPHIWHGRADGAVEPAAAERFADAADAALHLVEGGHYSTLVEHGEEILLAAAGRE